MGLVVGFSFSLLAMNIMMLAYFLGVFFLVDFGADDFMIVSVCLCVWMCSWMFSIFFLLCGGRGYFFIYLVVAVCGKNVAVAVGVDRYVMDGRGG